MDDQKRRAAIVTGDDIDSSQFNFTRQEIENFSEEFENVKAYTTKIINEDNFQELCIAWYKLIDRIPLAPIPVDVRWLLRARPNLNGEIFKEECDISYNTKNISAIKVNRFNRPEESVFYAILPSELMFRE
jgi:hypothetical protein